MLHAYRSYHGKLTAMAEAEDISQAIWIDLFKPTPDEAARTAG